jgi:DNA modification methylase
MYTTEEIILKKEKLELDILISNSQKYRNELFQNYQDKLKINRQINRSLISFQANKNEPFYRWFKYKEGFSSTFVKYILNLFGTTGSDQTVLDPFAGIGTTVTTSIQNGFNAIGIELLPPGILATKARIAASCIEPDDFSNILKSIENLNFQDKNTDDRYFFKHLTITKGAFSKETELAIANVQKFIEERCENPEMKELLKFSVSSILEDVSFTRKDGQYLRWDYRSDRKLKSKFSKGEIHSFKPRLIQKLKEIQGDILEINRKKINNNFNLIQGSCLTKMHEIADESIDMVITSPPYCNRYDYTRTYALELAFNGIDDNEIKNLRQTLLSATVENKSKYNQLKKIYSDIHRSETFRNAVYSFRNQLALQEALENLRFHKNILNNKNIPDMVANYFFEMNFVIRELARTLKKNGKIIMVNDNVRYNGDEIPVDLILSEFARESGLKTEIIWVLERGKGNSSQQMGVHGRKEMRKCVYVWSK